MEDPMRSTLLAVVLILAPLGFGGLAHLAATMPGTAVSWAAQRQTNDEAVLRALSERDSNPQELRFGKLHELPGFRISVR